MFIVDESSIENKIKVLGGSFAGPDVAEWSTAIFHDDCNLSKLYDIFEELNIEYKTDKKSDKYIVKFKTRECPTVTPNNVTNNVKVSKYRVSVGDKKSPVSKVPQKEFLVRFVDAAFIVKADDAKSAATLAYDKYKSLD